MYHSTSQVRETNQLFRLLEVVIPQREDLVSGRLVLLEPCHLFAFLREATFYSEGGSQLSVEVWCKAPETNAIDRPNALIDQPELPQRVTQPLQGFAPKSFYLSREGQGSETAGLRLCAGVALHETCDLTSFLREPPRN